MLLSASRLRSAAAVLALVGVVTGCSGSGDELDVDGFSEGACRDLAATAQEVDTTLREVADEDIAAREAADRLRAAQDELKPVRDRADEPVSAAVTELVTRIGFFRISVDSNNYDGSQVEDVRTALEELASACTAS